MIKIITPGSLPTQTATCHKCGCVFSYEPGDSYIDYQLSSVSYAINCPYCGEKLAAFGFPPDVYPAFNPRDTWPPYITCQDVRGGEQNNE